MIHKEKEDLLLVPFDLSLIYKYMVSLFSFTVATPTVYSTAPFVNIEASKSATFSVTFVTYTPSM